MAGSRSKTKGAMPPLFRQQVNQNTMRFFQFLWSYLQHELVNQTSIPRSTYSVVCESSGLPVTDVNLLSNSRFYDNDFSCG